MTALSVKVDALPWHEQHPLQGRVSALLNMAILRELGWDPDDLTITPNTKHPVYLRHRCRARNCSVISWHELNTESALCTRHRHLWRKLGKPTFTGEWDCPLPAAWASRQPSLCAVCRTPGHERPAARGRLLCRSCCAAAVRRKVADEEYVRHPAATPRPTYGRCAHAGCGGWLAADSARDPLCFPHRRAWNNYVARASREGLEVGTLQEWLERHQRLEARALDQTVVLGDLPKFVRSQLLLVFQMMTLDERSGAHAMFHRLQSAARRLRVNDLRDLDVAALGGYQPAATRQVLRQLCLALTTIDEEVEKDTWNMRVFGYAAGYLTFTERARVARQAAEHRKRAPKSRPAPGLSQAWLIGLAKIWFRRMAAQQRSYGTLSSTMCALGELSASLRVSRPDAGEDFTRLRRRDIDAFVAHVHALARDGHITAGSVHHRLRNADRVLRDIRDWGCTDPGEDLHGLPNSFTFARTDIPRRLEKARGEPGAALPAVVIRQLRTPAALELLDQLAGPSGRHAVELAWGVGRRPAELVGLPYECLDVDEVVEVDGTRRLRHVLVHDMPKANVAGYRLPISEYDAGLIQAQRAHVRSRYPNTPTDRLALFPATQKNQSGCKPLKPRWLANKVLVPWLAALPPLDAPEHDDSGYATSDPNVIDGTDVAATDDELTNDVLKHTGSLRSVDDRERAQNPGRRLFPKAKITFYAFRHTWAQLHADEGTPQEVLQAMMGHINPTTTMGYFRTPMRRRHEAVRQVARLQVTHRGVRMHERPVGTATARLLELGQVIPHGYCAEPANKKAGGGACPVTYSCTGCKFFSTDATFLPELYEHRKRLIQQRESVVAMIDDHREQEALVHLLDQRIARYATLIQACVATLDELDEADRKQALDDIRVLRATRSEYNARIPSDLRGVVRNETDVSPYLSDAFREEMSRPTSMVVR